MLDIIINLELPSGHIVVYKNEYYFGLYNEIDNTLFLDSSYTAVWKRFVAFINKMDYTK